MQLRMPAATLLLALLTFACASSDRNRDDAASSTDPRIEIFQVADTADSFRFGGPVNVDFVMRIGNPSPDTIKIHRVELRTVSSGAYTLRGTPTYLNEEIPPNSEGTLRFSVWGHARGGSNAATEPVTLRGTAFYETAEGPRQKVFTQIMSQTGRAVRR